MASWKVSTGVLGAIAGAAMLAGAAQPAAAFTLPATAPVHAFANADVQHVWWDRWGRWHPNHPWGWRRWGWGPPPPMWGPPRVYGYYGGYGPRRCWIGPWGRRHCAW